MAILTVLWEKWVEFRRDWLQITLSGLVAPLLYILTFGLLEFLSCLPGMER